MKIGIVGVGYVGLVTAACLSDLGHQVVCWDSDKKKIDNLKKGVMPIFEPGLKSLVRKNYVAERLSFDYDITAEIGNCEAVFIAVGTPLRRGDGNTDLSDLFNVAKNINDKLSSRQILVIKSTVPVGTNKRLDKDFNRSRKNKIGIVSNPEFLREGSAIEDFMKPDRIIIGRNNRLEEQLMTEVYKPICANEVPIMFTDPESAELIKYASNAFLATKISFINEIANLCDSIGCDVKEVSRGIGLDNRIGNKFLDAGPGFGGSCLPKDSLALTKMGRNYEAPQTIVETVIQVNNQIKHHMVEKILKFFDKDLNKKIIAIFGITFKPNTDDIREAPSLTILPALNDKGATIRVVDPEGLRYGQKALPFAIWHDNPYTAAKSSDLIVLLTEWNEFRALDLKKLASNMRSANLLDLRNIYSKDEVLNSGFTRYEAVGR